MAAEALLAKVDIPPENIHPIETRGCEPETSALRYHDEIAKQFGCREGERPVFDVILLGLGQDGHIASLFPGSPALDEKTRFVVSALDEELGEKRITLTLPVINRARQILFMVSGKEKAEALYTVLESGEQRYAIPARLVRPEQGTVSWFVDKPAGFFLNKLRKLAP